MLLLQAPQGPRADLPEGSLSGQDPWAGSGPLGAPAFVPTPIGEQFIHAFCAADPDEFRFLILEGSRGEGKTASTVIAILAMAERITELGMASALPYRVGVVRDTWKNLSRTTIESLRDLQRQGLAIQFIEQESEAAIRDAAGRELVHFWFFGLDRPADADRFQGFTCGCLWLEEVAPAADFSTGVPQESFGIGMTSVRQEGVPLRVVVTMNPPDEDHWIVNVEQYLATLGRQEIRVHRFFMPPGHKAEHFRVLAAEARDKAEGERWERAAKRFESYRERSRQALEAIGRGDLATRLIGGERSGVKIGEPVVPQFSHRLHVSQAPVTIYPHLPIIRGWDTALHPGVVFFQTLPANGGVNVIGSLAGVNLGMAQFLLEEVLPFQEKYGLKRRGVQRPGQDIWRRGVPAGQTWRDIGDPSAATGDNSNSERSAKLTIENMLGTHFEPGPVAFSARVQALHAAFLRRGRGERMFIQIDREENKQLIAALAGRAHYPVDASGKVTATAEAFKRATDPIYSALIDGLGYALAVLYPAHLWLKATQRSRAPSEPLSPAKTWLDV